MYVSCEHGNCEARILNGRGGCRGTYADGIYRERFRHLGDDRDVEILRPAESLTVDPFTLVLTDRNRGLDFTLLRIFLSDLRQEGSGRRV